MIYFVILLFFFIFTYRYDYCKRRKGRAFAYWGMFVVLVLLAGLRYRLGVDSIRYEVDYADFPTIFELAKYNFSGTRYEPGFLVFASIPRTLSPDFTYLQLFEAFVVNATVWWFTSKYAKNRFLYLAIYYVFTYLTLNFQVMREALAVCIFLYSWPLIKSGKWIWYYCLASVAIFFHTSSIFMLILPLFFLPGIRNFFKFGYRTLIICALITVTLIVLQNMFFHFFQLITISDRIVDRAKMYDNMLNRNSGLNVMGMIGVFMQYMLYPILAMAFIVHNYRIRKRQEHVKERRPEWWKMEVMVVTGLYIGAACMALFIMIRYFHYFNFFLALAVSDVVFDKYITSEKKIKIRPVYWYIALLPLFVFAVKSYWASAVPSGLLKTYCQYYPYSSRLNPTDNTDREKYYRFERAR